MLCRFAPVVTGAADLHRHAGGELGWIDNGLAFFKNSRLGKRCMPGPFAVTGLAADGGFDKSLFFKIDAGGVTAAALQKPRVFVPGGFVVVHPAIRIRKILNRRYIKCSVLFYNKTLLPLAADGVLDFFDLGNVDLIGRDLQCGDFRQVFANLLFIKIRDEHILVFLSILSHAAVKCHHPGIEVLKVTHLAGLGTHKGLRHGFQRLEVGHLLAATGSQKQGHETHDQDRQAFTLHLDLLCNVSIRMFHPAHRYRKMGTVPT